MKNLVLTILAIGAATSAHAAPYQFQGSDTLAGVITDAIIAAGMNNEMAYLGGGSGKGEAAIIKGEQGIAPMSRAMTDDAANTGKAKGYTFTDHVIALDGVGVFVNKANATAAIDIPTLKKIFECTVTDWRDVPNSGRSGRINAFRRNDASGTTDTFKNLVGVTKFGACVTIMAETVDIAEKTASDQWAVGYSGHTALRDGNKCLKVARDANSPAIDLNVNTIRAFTYPLARQLHVYEIGGSMKPNATEAKFLKKVLDRSFLDPIIQNNEFYTLN
jgi:phosphate transport system substrate-binding protein